MPCQWREREAAGPSHQDCLHLDLDYLQSAGQGDEGFTGADAGYAR